MYPFLSVLLAGNQTSFLTISWYTSPEVSGCSDVLFRQNNSKQVISKHIQVYLDFKHFLMEFCVVLLFIFDIFCCTTKHCQTLKFKLLFTLGPNSLVLKNLFTLGLYVSKLMYTSKTLRYISLSIYVFTVSQCVSVVFTGKIGNDQL